MFWVDPGFSELWSSPITPPCPPTGQQGVRAPSAWGDRGTSWERKDQIAHGGRRQQGGTKSSWRQTVSVEVTLPRDGRHGHGWSAEGSTETEILGADGGCCTLYQRERMGTLQVVVSIFRCLLRALPPSSSDSTCFDGFIPALNPRLLWVPLYSKNISTLCILGCYLSGRGIFLFEICFY